MNPGDRIGDYTIVRSIGAGSPTRVFRVRHEITGRIEAMKVLPPEHTKDEESRDRFLREARIKAGLNHPNIASLVTALDVDGQLYMVMEYVEGESLDRKLARGRLPRPVALRYASQVLAGLSYAHAHGVVHRDIRPENLLIGPGDVLKITEFGLASTQEDAQNKLSDVYSIGAVLYELVTGKRPSAGTEPAAPAELDPSIPYALSEAIRKAMHKNPEDRFASADEFRREIDAVLGGRPASPEHLSAAETKPKRSRRLVAALALAAAAMAGVWFLPSSPEPAEPEPDRSAPAPVASALLPLAETSTLALSASEPPSLDPPLPTSTAETAPNPEPKRPGKSSVRVTTAAKAEERKPSPIPAPEPTPARAVEVRPSVYPSPPAALTKPDMIQIRLLTPVRSDDASDSPVAGEVIRPAELTGARVEGRLVESRSSQRPNGLSIVELEFAMLRHRGKTMLIDGRVAEIRNSQGTPGVDDLDHPLRGNGGLLRRGRKAAGRIGGAIGGLFGAGKKHDDASSSTVVTANAPNIAFLPGSEFELELSEWSQIAPAEAR